MVNTVSASSSPMNTPPRRRYCLSAVKVMSSVIVPDKMHRLFSQLIPSVVTTEAVSVSFSPQAKEKKIKN